MAKRRRRVNRAAPKYVEEAEALGQGFSLIAGVDEAGRGPLAGPVVAGVAVLPVSPSPGWSRIVRDSKLLTPDERKYAFAFLQRNALGVATGMADHVEIDRLGIAPATRLAMSRAVHALLLRPQFLLLDAFPLPELDIPQKAIVHGDALCLSIAAASVVAKVTRDRLMGVEHTAYPRYDFASNKGYATAHHLRALEEHGPFAHTPAIVRPDQIDDPVTPDRQRIGREGEAVARRRLSAMGYRVLQANYRAKGGEIDLVCTKGETLVFVEVRTKGPSSYGSPEESITAAKREHLVAAAQEYMQANEAGDVEWRIDLVAVEYGRDGKVTRLDVIENAVEI